MSHHAVATPDVHRRDHDAVHGHSHGLVDPSIMRSRQGLRVVGVSLAILTVTALIQAAIYLATDSVALLADLIHNAGDALTAVPLAVAFLLRSQRAERGAGIAVVVTILASAVTPACSPSSALSTRLPRSTCSRWHSQARSGWWATRSPHACASPAGGA